MAHAFTFTDGLCKICVMFYTCWIINIIINEWKLEKLNEIHVEKNKNENYLKLLKYNYLYLLKLPHYKNNKIIVL